MKQIDKDDLELIKSLEETIYSLRDAVFNNFIDEISLKITKQELEKQFFDVEKQKKELSDIILAKYGEGKIDLNTGTIEDFKE